MNLTNKQILIWKIVRFAIVITTVIIIIIAVIKEIKGI